MIGEEEKAEILDTLDSGWITTGPKTEAFEQAVCAYLGGGYAVAVHSCTAALHLSLVAAGIEEGEFVSSGLILEDFLDEMSATSGVAISDEQNGFRFRVPFDKRREKGNEERDEK